MRRRRASRAPAGGPVPPQGPRNLQRRATAGASGWPHRIRVYGGWVALAGVLLVGGMFAYVLWTIRDLPDPGHQGILANSVVVYDRKGRVIETVNSEGQFHEILGLKDMGRWGPAATLAAEDRNFYQHGPIDYGSTLRSVYVDVTTRGYAQGGSTISQQLIKIQLLTPQKSIFRKLQEATLATALEQHYSKDQILEMYLNRVYYGHNSYGLGAASRTYFSKDAKDLTPAQAAFLAGLIQAPTYYDPLTQYGRAKARQEYVLDGMVATHALSRAEADQAKREDVKAELKYTPPHRQSSAPHFVDYVMSKLEQQFGSAAIQQGGFAVYTTLDVDLQRLSDKAVADGVASLRGEGVNNGALLAVKPDTGEILAWSGSADYYNDPIGGRFDVVLSPRQVGSSFKPYVYEAALKDRKITLATITHDVRTDFGGGYIPKDFDNNYMGDMSARRALLLSRNVPAVAVGQAEGMQNVNRLAQAMGVQADLKTVPSAAIGSSEISLASHLQGYATFANQGQKVPLISIVKVNDGQGNLLYEQIPGQQDGREQVLSSAEAYLISDTLKDYNSYWHMGWNRQMAAKSGTTGGDELGIHRDAWMMAYSPDLAVGAWMGNTQAGGGGKSISTFGTEVGQTTLRQFLNSLPPPSKPWYQRPEGIVEGRGCTGQSEIFLAGTDRNQGCPTPPSSPSPSPSPSPTPLATPTPSPSPSSSASPRPSSSPSPSPSHSPTPLPTP